MCEVVVGGCDDNSSVKRGVSADVEKSVRDKQKRTATDGARPWYASGHPPARTGSDTLRRVSIIGARPRKGERALLKKGATAQTEKAGAPVIQFKCALSIQLICCQLFSEGCLWSWDPTYAAANRESSSAVPSEESHPPGPSCLLAETESTSEHAW